MRFSLMNFFIAFATYHYSEMCSIPQSMIVFTSIMKLLFFPLIAFIIVSQIGFTNLEFNVSIIEAAMPSGMLSLLLSITYKLDFELTSDCILINTVISLITLPAIILLL